MTLDQWEKRENFKAETGGSSLGRCRVVRGGQEEPSGAGECKHGVRKMGVELTRS